MIVYYHSVGGLPPQTLAAEVFAEHLAILDRHGVRAAGVSDVARKGGLALSFDDGLADNLHVAAPMLASRGHVGTFFVVPDHFGTVRWVDPATGRWSDEARPGYTVPHPVLDALGVRSLAAMGMEIGSHTRSHRKLPTVPEAELDAELDRRPLEELVGQPIRALAYPHGRFSPRVVRAVRKAGYDVACATIPGYRAWHRYAWPRFLVEDPAFFDAIVRGRAFTARAIFGLMRVHGGRLTAPSR